MERVNGIEASLSAGKLLGGCFVAKLPFMHELILTITADLGFEIREPPDLGWHDGQSL